MIPLQCMIVAAHLGVTGAEIETKLTVLAWPNEVLPENSLQYLL